MMAKWALVNQVAFAPCSEPQFPGKIMKPKPKSKVLPAREICDLRSFVIRDPVQQAALPPQLSKLLLVRGSSAKKR